jgi:hypothetical protein
MCGNLYICDAVFQEGKDTIEGRPIATDRAIIYEIPLEL